MRAVPMGLSPTCLICCQAWSTTTPWLSVSRSLSIDDDEELQICDRLLLCQRWVNDQDVAAAAIDIFGQTGPVCLFDDDRKAFLLRASGVGCESSSFH